MAKKLPKWCKEAKIAMIEQDIGVAELADLAGLSREYTSAIINGRIYSEPAVSKISSRLDIDDSYYD